MELEDLKGLIELLKDTDITELLVEKDGTKVKIKREKIFSSVEIPSPKVQESNRNVSSPTTSWPAASNMGTITEPI